MTGFFESEGFGILVLAVCVFLAFRMLDKWYK